MKILADHNINGMAHITGGGLTENIPRSIPKDFSVTINKNAWEMPEIFLWLQEKGNLKEEDMYRVFNCGIGMVLIVNRDDVDSIQKDISDHGYKNFIIGEVVKKNTDYPVKYL